MPLLLHLSDVHLGARHADLGVAAARQRERQLAAYARAIEMGLEKGVEAVLICGDLFDSNAQPRRSVERAVAELRRLLERGIHVVIIPGTHDCYDARSIYRAFDLPRLAGLPPGSDLLTVLTPERPDLVLKDLDLVVYGRVFATKRAPRSPLEGFSTRGDGRAAWKVGMIHGSLQIPGRVDRDEVLFTEAEVAASGLDYLALGHWHSWTQGRAGNTTWLYPGAPEPMAVDQDGAGSVALVRLGSDAAGAGRVHVERLAVGQTAFREEAVDAASLASQAELVQRLREMADEDLVLRVEIRGVAPDRLEIDPLEVQQALAPSFLHIRVEDRSVPEVTSGPELPHDTVAGRFVRDMESRIRAAEAKSDVGAAEHGRQVLRLGRRLLLDDPDHVSLA